MPGRVHNQRMGRATRKLKFARLDRSQPEDPGQLSSASVTPPLPKTTALKRVRKSTKKSPDSEENNLIPVPTQHNDNVQRGHTKHRAGALRRLGITSAQMQGVPQVSHVLAHAEGGIPTVIASLRLCDDADSGKFLDVWDRISASDLEFVSVEEVCVAAGVAPKRLLEIAVSSLVEDGMNAGKIIAATYHPRVIRATAQCAELFPDNQSDRRLFLQGTGFLPAPVNRPGGVFAPTINLNMPPVPQVGDGGESDEGPMFNAAEDDLKTMHELLDGNKMLEAPKVIENAAAIQIGHQYRDQEILECVPSIPNRKS